MDPITWAAVISAGAGILSSFMGKRATEKASNTSYQRAFKDMRKAGINPIMAFQQGGASTPTFNFQNPAADLPSDVASAKRVKIEKSLAAKQGALIETQAEVASKNAQSQADSVWVQQQDLNWRKSPANPENQLRAAQAGQASAQAGFLQSGKAVRDWDVKLGEQSFERGKLSAAQNKSIERLFDKMGEGTGADLGRMILQILMSMGATSARGGSVSVGR